MEEAITEVLGEVEKHQPDGQVQRPVPESVLVHMQFLLDNACNEQGVDCLYEELSSRNLSMDSIVRMIISAMDCSLVRLSLLASRVYLSLLLSPNAPVFTLFTPLAFLSLLRSIRQGLKSWRSPKESEGSVQRRRNRKRKGAARGKHVIDDAEERDENRFDERVLVSVLEKFEPVLALVHLSRFPDSLKLLIQTVVSIANGICEKYSELYKSCWRILSQLLRPEHGNQAVTASEILKHLSPSILTMKSPAHDSAIRFMKSKMMTAADQSADIKKAVVNLPRYLVQKAPEKSELRALAAESIMEIISVLEHNEQVEFADYVAKMSQGKPNLRLLAVDLLPMIVMSLEDVENFEEDASWNLKCFRMLLERSSDVNAMIRARATTNMAQFLGHLSNQDLLKRIPGFNDLLDKLLRERCMDEKALVRRAALLLVTKLSSQQCGSLNTDLLKLVSMSCSDPLVSIRKAATSALSEAFRRPCDRTVITEWLHSVPRLVNDNETSIQEECESFFTELVLGRVSRTRSIRLAKDQSDLEQIFPEGVLNVMEEICNGEVTPWVRKLCMSLGKKNRLKPDVAAGLQNIIRISETLWLSHCKQIEKWTAPPGAWLLLSEVSTFLPKAVDWEFLHHYWEILDKHGVEGEDDNFRAMDDEEINSVSWAADRVFLLKTISNVSLKLPPEPAADLAHNLLRKLEGFIMHSSEVNAHVKALKTLCMRKAVNPEEANILVERWVMQLLSKACKILECFISEEGNKENGFLTPPQSRSRFGRRRKKSGMPLVLPEGIAAVYTIGALAIACPSANLSSAVPVLHTIIMSGSSCSRLSHFPGAVVDTRQITSSLYVQAWITLGKICLADGKLAKKYIPLFVQELEKSELPALRNNIVVMMADFCVRYTALIDCYISRITKCLRDPCELVRRQTFILLSRLLQRDYVKWRGVLFLRFLLSLVDESEKIRQLADYLFGNILKAKAPLLAYNSFVEAIFVLNDCCLHSGYDESRNRRVENRMFSIRGNDENSRLKRMHIYVSLLKQMAPEHLLATTAKVCGEILAAASDGMLKIEELSGQSVLQDAFSILACKEIRISSIRGPAGGSGDMEDEGGGEAGASSAKGRALSQAIKKGVIQHTIPIFIELKRLLESKNSSLTGSLMECLRLVLKDYKNEIEEILVADKQLQKELIYDMQKYESSKAKSSGDSASAGVASAMNDVAAAAAARSVIKQMNRGSPNPPLSAISVPKLRTSVGGSAAQCRPVEVLHSVRRRQSFGSDDEN